MASDSTTTQSSIDTFKSIFNPEKSPNGNSGDPSKTVRQSNRDAVESRAAGSEDSTVKTSTVVQKSVGVSNGSSADPASVKTTSNVGLDQNFNNPFTNDGYRKSPNPGLLPSRELDEDPDKIASIAVRAGNGKEIIKGFSNFFLQSVTESEQEKYQIVETFTAFYTFFYGKRPPMYTFSGLLLNDSKQNWANTFKYMYENYFRGTASADLNAEAVITYDQRSVTGYILNLTMQQDAMNNKGIPFSFTVLVIRHDILAYSEDFNSFVLKEQENLRTLRAAASKEIKSLNRNPDGLSQIFKNQALTGIAPVVETKKDGVTDEVKPASNLKTGDQLIGDAATMKKSEPVNKESSIFAPDPSAAVTK